MTAISRKMAAEEKREDDILIIKQSQGRDVEWYDPVYAQHKTSAPLHESHQWGWLLFGWLLFDPAGPIVVNRFD